MIDDGYEEIAEYLSYDFRTGIFCWVKKPCRAVRVGTVAGTVASNGYLRIVFRGRAFYGHRLAWLLFFGWLPIEVDHRNGDRFDNRLDNLRLASRSQQGANTKRPSDNTSGVKGVSFDSRRQKYRAYYDKDGRHVFLGYFLSLEQAAAVRAAAFEDAFGSFARAA